MNRAIRPENGIKIFYSLFSDHRQFFSRFFFGHNVHRPLCGWVSITGWWCFYLTLPKNFSFSFIFFMAQSEKIDFHKKLFSTQWWCFARENNGDAESVWVTVLLGGLLWDVFKQIEKFWIFLKAFKIGAIISSKS